MGNTVGSVGHDLRPELRQKERDDGVDSKPYAVGLTLQKAPEDTDGPRRSQRCQRMGARHGTSETGATSVKMWQKKEIIKDGMEPISTAAKDRADQCQSAKQCATCMEGGRACMSQTYRLFEKRAVLTNKRCLTSRVEGGTQDQCQFWLKLVSEFYPSTSSI